VADKQLEDLRDKFAEGIETSGVEPYQIGPDYLRSVYIRVLAAADELHELRQEFYDALYED
jgi:hypothetical protein